jgi:DNA polymerase III sliding clamp (beta) subunit (PCNA family)
MNQEQRTVNIEIGDKEWEGVYSNFVIITHSTSEFVLDFARMLPGAHKAKVFSRILMTPQHAKALLGTLENNIKKFEAENGPIKLAAEDPAKGPIGFQTGVTPQPPKKD